MDPQTFQLVVGLFGLMATIIGALVMRWVGSVQASQKDHAKAHGELASQHNQLALDIARNYMPRDELEKKLDSIFALLEEIRKEVRHA